MKKTYKKLILAVSVFIGIKMYAQVAQYSFTQFGGTYAAVSGGTVFGTTTSNAQRFVDPAVPNGGTIDVGVGIPIGFNFVYDQITFDRFAISTNGYISLGNATITPDPVNIQATNVNNFLSSASTAPAALQHRIGALGANLQGQAGSQIRAVTLGSAPNRTLVVQWSGYRYSGNTGDNLNFQIRLFETTNIINFVYGTMVISTASTAQIGLRGSSNTDFNNRNVITTNQWATSIAGTSNNSQVNLSSTLFPVSGQNYQWTPPPPCSGTPDANAAVTNSAAVCSGASANLSFASTYTVSGLTYQWYVSTNGIGGPYNAITGATNAVVTATNITTASYFRAVVTCTNGMATTTTTPVQVMINTNPCECNTYCQSEALDVGDDEIYNVSIGTLSNTSTCGQTGGPGSILNIYSNYAGIVAAPSLSAGATYTLGVIGGQCDGTDYDGYVTAFIDYNQNGLFTDPGELIYTSPLTTFSVVGTPMTAVITIPSNATIGTARLRVVLVEDLLPTPPQGPCSTYDYGETEDYCVNIVAPPNCTSASSGTLSSNSITACSGETISLSSTGATFGTGIVYQWQVSNTPNGPYANVIGGNGATTTSYTTAPLAAGTFYYVLQTTCTLASLSAISNEGTVTVNPTPSAAAGSNGPICAGQALNLTGSSNIGTSFAWSGPGGFTSGLQNPSFTSVINNSGGTYSLIVSTPNCTAAPVTVFVSVNAVPPTFSLTPPTSTYCAGGSQTIAVSVPASTSPTLTYGTQANQNGATGVPSPYSVYYGGQKMQMLILASELTAAGFVQGSPFVSLQFPVVSLGANWGVSIFDCKGFQVNVGHTALTTLSAFQTGLTNVVAPMNFTPVVGYSNIHNFNLPFTWDGTSNVILETTFSNNMTGDTPDAVIHYFTPGSFQSTIIHRDDNQTPATIAAATATTDNVGLRRPDFKLNGLSIGSYSWSPATGLSSTTAETVTANPLSTIVYTVTLSNSTCSSVASSTVNVIPMPALTIAASVTAVCLGSSAIFTVSGATTYSWSTTATTATISVSPTVPTTYTVTGANGSCTATATKSLAVNALPSVSLTPSTGTTCATIAGGSTIALNGLPVSGNYSGTNVTGNIFTPAATGTFTPAYSYTNPTTGCSNTATTTIVVAICTGLNETLTVINGLLVYPNPNTGEFTIELNNGSFKTIDIMDLTGRVVVSNTSSNDRVDFNINTLANGIYYVRIQSNSTVEVIKIIKQ